MQKNKTKTNEGELILGIGQARAILESENEYLEDYEIEKAIEIFTTFSKLILKKSVE